MTRIDHTFYLAHFTKSSEKNSEFGVRNESALNNLISILRDKTIKKSTIPWTGVPAVCFTECPWSSLLKHAEAYSPYGIGFNKPYVYMKGGNPVFYANPDIFNSQDKWDERVYPFLTPFVPFYAAKKVKEQKPFDGRAIDYSHEREWRILDDFRFDYSEIRFVVLEKIEDLDSIPESIVDEIGKNNFLFINIYKKIEELWPTHIID